MRLLIFAACLLSACTPAPSAPAASAPAVDAHVTEAPTFTPGRGLASASPMPPTATAAPSLSPAPSPGDTPEPLTPMELKVIGALRALGVPGQRAQHPGPESASIWANFGAGSHFFVSAGATWTRAREASFSVLDERELDGIRVQHARYDGSGSTHHRFECSGDTYAFSGAVPPGSSDMYVFVGRFIRALGCKA